MKVELEPGRYVVAVSGGVDSVALLDLLRQLPGVKLTVAHFDHGIRSDSTLDRQLVQQLVQQYKLPFVYGEGHLGAGTSEAVAREARYNFLRQVQQAAGAQAIITAHHQDDLLETAILNMLRGTGRKGVTSLKDHYHLRRPMLHLSKQQIRDYANEQGLNWREDSTNSDMTILRNYVRGTIVPRLGQKGRAELLNHIGHMSVVNRAVDHDLMLYLHLQPSRQSLDRHSFTQLPYDLSLEVMAEWLRGIGITQFNRKQLEQLVARSKTLEPGKQVDIDAGHRLMIGRESLVLVKTVVV
jgi:tRNA(Ile)-lysidine synthase